MKADRLAAVLRVRRIQERRARGELAASNAERRRAHDAECAARDAVAARGTNLSAAVSAAGLRAELAIVESGLLAVETRRGVTQHAAGLVVERTAEWSATARRVDAMERLERRVLELDRAERARVEQTELDDLAAERHRRRVGERP